MTTAQQPPLLRVDALGVEIAHKAVLSDVTLELQAGDSLGLVGETGSGKSLTCRAIMGLLPRIGGAVTSGSIAIDGTDLTSFSQKQWQAYRGREIGFVPQASLNGLDPVMTVGRQLTESISALDPDATPHPRAIELLEMVEMSDPVGVLNKYPHQLSGGMRQRVMIALALTGRPRLLIADEPTTALDVTVQRAILDVFASLRTYIGMSLLIVTHDLGVISTIANRVAVMYGGTIVESGRTMSVLEEPLHPYTTALLDARPSTHHDGVRLATIPGQPAMPGAWPTGCRFAPRCPMVHDGCDDRQPALLTLERNRSVACTIYEEEVDG